MTAKIAFQALMEEIEQLFPADGRQRRALAQPLDELRRVFDGGGEALADAGPLLDVIEDLLESLLRASGWPAGQR
ncbi:hypothetical protein [Nannocystis sp. SCPEA4]|uniref:hypothetical protein n=1 Tax=Nannocystis sp. SCPEA4 TaxID=2996787 RepID=UPI002271A075|nr:hypothetical protein [Nannocystis sp. SCPEA4]MCY1059591.1 hypothetical protein [Nannocystis sp. SCPEA4]